MADELPLSEILYTPFPRKSQLDIAYQILSQILTQLDNICQSCSLLIVQNGSMLIVHIYHLCKTESHIVTSAKVGNQIFCCRNYRLLGPQSLNIPQRIGSKRAKVMRKAPTIQEFNVKFEFQVRKAISVGDCFSRLVYMSYNLSLIHI